MIKALLTLCLAISSAASVLHRSESAPSFQEALMNKAEFKDIKEKVSHLTAKSHKHAKIEGSAPHKEAHERSKQVAHPAAHGARPQMTYMDMWYNMDMMYGYNYNWDFNYNWEFYYGFDWEFYYSNNYNWEFFYNYNWDFNYNWEFYYNNNYNWDFYYNNNYNWEFFYNYNWEFYYNNNYNWEFFYNYNWEFYYNYNYNWEFFYNYNWEFYYGNWDFNYNWEFYNADDDDNSINGYVYMEYFPTSDCSGTSSASSGFIANYCIDEYYYSYMFTFSSESCDSITITYFYDRYCSYEMSSSSISSFSTCAMNDEQTTGSSYLYMKGMCSTGWNVPVSTSSYLSSQFNYGAIACSGYATNFTAYTLDSCLSDNTMSSRYTCNADGSVVTTKTYSTQSCTTFMDKTNTTTGCAASELYYYSPASYVQETATKVAPVRESRALRGAEPVVAEMKVQHPVHPQQKAPRPQHMAPAAHKNAPRRPAPAAHKNAPHRPEHMAPAAHKNAPHRPEHMAPAAHKNAPHRPEHMAPAAHKNAPHRPEHMAPAAHKSAPRRPAPAARHPARKSADMNRPDGFKDDDSTSPYYNFYFYFYNNNYYNFYNYNFYNFYFYYSNNNNFYYYFNNHNYYNYYNFYFNYYYFYNNYNYNFYYYFNNHNYYNFYNYNFEFYYNFYNYNFEFFYNYNYNWEFFYNYNYNWDFYSWDDDYVWEPQVYTNTQCVYPNADDDTYVVHFPTMAPTTFNLVEFQAYQVISGISYSTYMSNMALYNMTLASTIASCMSTVNASNIMNIIVSANRRLTVLPMDSSSSSINTQYTVSLHTSLTYEFLSTQLQTNIDSGVFDTNLQMYATQYNATGLESASSSTVSTENLVSAGSDDDSNLSGGAIAGIVIAIVVFFGLAAFGVYYFMFMRSASSTAAAETKPSDVEVGSKSEVQLRDTKGTFKEKESTGEAPVFGIAAMSGVKKPPADREDDTM